MSRLSSDLRNITASWRANKTVKPGVCKWLEVEADRIDAEMVELPRGRDGRPIHIGDTVYDGYDDALTVESMTLSDRYARVKASGKRAVYDGLDPERLTHERPDSWERIADELERYVNDSCGEDEIDGATASTLVDFAERIRRMAEEREHERE